MLTTITHNSLKWIGSSLEAHVTRQKNHRHRVCKIKMVTAVLLPIAVLWSSFVHLQVRPYEFCAFTERQQTFPLIILICFMKVLFPLSPLPRRRIFIVRRWRCRSAAIVLFIVRFRFLLLISSSSVLCPPKQGQTLTKQSSIFNFFQKWHSLFTPD